jgi:hypothetical protein
MKGRGVLLGSLIALVSLGTLYAAFASRSDSTKNAAQEIAVQETAGHETTVSVAATPAQSDSVLPPHPVKHVRARGRTPLPPANTPLRLSQQALSTLAAAGDVEAAARLLRESSACLSANMLKKEFEVPASEDPLSDKFYNNAVTETEISSKQEELESLQHDVDLARRSKELCDGIGDEIADGRLYWIALNAAELGDDKAANCFVEGVFLPSNVMDDADVYNSYSSNVLKIAEARVEKGDADMVFQLMRWYGNNFKFMQADVPQKDPAKSYMYAHLLSLIATPSTSLPISQTASYMAQSLSPNDVASADMQAKDLFDRFFGKNSDIVFPRKSAVCNGDYLSP